MSDVASARKWVLRQASKRLHSCLECCLRCSMQIWLSTGRQQYSIVSGEWHVVWRRSQMCLYAIILHFTSARFISIHNLLFSVKTCPRLLVPYYGMATCKNEDLNLVFDYSPRNSTFMESYHRDDLRITEAMPIDTDCSFKCGPGFSMTGSRMRNCLPLSKWDGIQTGCKRKI